MQSLFARRARWRVSALLLVLALVAGAALAAWNVTQAHPAAPVQIIDWQYPVRVPGPGMALSGVGSPATGDLLTPQAQVRSNAQAVLPQADFPSTCYRGTAYQVRVLGNTVWTKNGPTLEAWATYLWCPRWAGDQVGLNFSYARAYVLAAGCRQIGFGLNQTWGFLGAMIGLPNQTYVEDGEPFVSYTVCHGHYAWDFSLTVPGNGVYSMGMDAFDLTTHTHTYAWSPAYY